MSYSDWSVYYVYNCIHTNPPKNKFVVIFNISPEINGFLINSEINKFILSRRYLKPCIAEINAKSNTFLKYDSYIDCRQMFDFKLDDLFDYKGVVCDMTKKNIIKSVIACSALELKFKNHLIGRYSDLIDF